MDDFLKISVIIPTYNRFSALQRTLLALNQQTLSLHAFEVILVDDGSAQDPFTVVPGLGLEYALRILRQSNRGPAAARNLGAENAAGEVLLFLDSDMIAMPDLLQQHLSSHEVPNRLVVGPRSRYPGENNINALDRFDYRPDGSDLRLDKQPLTFQEAYTCNLSVRGLAWNHLGGFNEGFRTPSFEDIEFAYRAVQIGMEILFNPHALAYHDHAISMQDRCKRAFSYTRTVPLFLQIHPDLRGKIIHLMDKEPIDWHSDTIGLIARKLIRFMLGMWPIFPFMEWIFHRANPLYFHEVLEDILYWKIIGGYQLKGFREGIKKYGWN